MGQVLGQGGRQEEVEEEEESAFLGLFPGARADLEGESIESERGE